jgi:hypothetical protein
MFRMQQAARSIVFVAVAMHNLFLIPWFKETAMFTYVRSIMYVVDLQEVAVDFRPHVNNKKVAFFVP